MITKPMLAASVDEVADLKFPLVATPKLDGIRALKVNGKLVSRSFKAIPNKHIRETLERILPDGIDGEVMAGATFQDVTSGVMRESGKPAFAYHAFDLVSAGLSQSYVDRLQALTDWFVASPTSSLVQVVKFQLVSNLDELLAFEESVLSQGYEGVILRTPGGPYKCGRSTLREHYLLKLKRFKDSEAEIIGLVEQEHNSNVAEKNELGHTKRSSAKAGKVPNGMLGAFQVRDLASGIEFDIGTGEGLTLRLRQDIWARRDEMIGKVVKYRFQEIGVKTKPRFPSFLGFRDERDM
jgi:DNA ligase-1